MSRHVLTAVLVQHSHRVIVSLHHHLEAVEAVHLALVVAVAHLVHLHVATLQVAMHRQEARLAVADKSNNTNI